MPAEKTLIEYARRVAEDIPEETAVVKFENSDSGILLNQSDEIDGNHTSEENSRDYEIVVKSSIQQNVEIPSDPSEKSLLTKTYETTINVFGQFHQDILALNAISLE